MKTIVPLAALAAALLFTSCSHEIHELSPLKSDEGLLGTSLRWEMAEDAGSAIHSLSIAAVGGSIPFSRHYKDAKEAAREFLTVSAGRNDILAMVNMADADGFMVRGMPSSKADAAVGEVLISLKDPLSSPAQAWFGIAGAEIKAGGVTVVECVLQRLLCSITMNLANVPMGTSVVFTLSNVAKSVSLTSRDADGRYGLPGMDSIGDLQIAVLSAASDGLLKVDGFTMLPTAAAFSRSVLTLDIISASGHRTRYVCDAPQMESGKGYTLELDYNSLRPYMYLDSYSISAWEDGWTVNGEVLNPNE